MSKAQKLSPLGINLSNLSGRDFSLYPGDRPGENPGVSTQHRLLFASLQNNPGISIHFFNSGWGEEGLGGRVSDFESSER
jgi:hypothetical protein